MGELRAASTPALALLVARGVPHTVHEYEIEAPSGPEVRRGARVAYGSAAAEALGVPPERLYKTLVIALEGGVQQTASSPWPCCRAALNYRSEPPPQHSAQSARHSPAWKRCNVQPDQFRVASAPSARAAPCAR